MDLNEAVQLMLGFISIIAVIVAVFRWKINQIKHDATSEVLSQKDIISNQKDINQLKGLIITLETRISDLCTRLSNLEGAFSQHNKERRD